MMMPERSMMRYWRWALVPFLVLSLAVCQSLRPAEQQKEQGFIWGVNGHPFVSYPGVSFAEQIDRVADLGLTHYRVDLRGENWRKPLRKLHRLARKQGITLLPILQPTLNMETMAPDEIYNISFDYAHAVAHEFRGKIHVFELGNEMENYAIIQPCEMRDDGTQYPCEWGPGSGDAVFDYYGPRWEKVSAALKGMSDGVAIGAPKARRAVGTAGWGHTAAFDRLAADGVKWDITVWHTYSLENSASFEEIAKWGKPIWITEFNNPRGSESSEAAQAEGLAVQMREFKESAETYNIEAAFIYELMDETYWAPDFESVMGMVRLEPDGDSWRAGEPKAAYTVVQELVAE